MCERYGATVTRLDGEWGRAVDPVAAARSRWPSTPADVVAMVHGETSTGVLQSRRASSRAIAREHDALTIVDAVTSFGGHAARRRRLGHRRLLQLHAEVPRRAVGPGADRVRAARARDGASSAAASTSICSCSKDYWLSRKYHHTMSSTLVYALYEALTIVEEEGLEARWARHERNHRAFVEGLVGARPVAAAAGERSAVDAQRRARSRRRGRGGGAQACCSTSSTSRSAPASVRWPARSGASA